MRLSYANHLDSYGILASRGPVATPPTVAITNPQQSDTLYVGSLTSVTGTAEATGATVSSVSVYLGNPYSGGELLGSATGTTSWSYDFTPSSGQIGNPKTLYALAMDSLGRIGLSSGVSVDIQSGADMSLPTSYSGIVSWFGAKGTTIPNTTVVAMRNIDYSTWTPTNATIVGGQVGYSGATGYLFTDGGTGSVAHYLTSGTGGTDTFYIGDQECWTDVKRVTGTVHLSVCLTVNFAGTANLDTLVCTSQANIRETQATALSDGWVRVKSIQAGSGGAAAAHIVGMSSNGTSLNGFAPAGNQLMLSQTSYNCRQERMSVAADNSGNLRDAVRAIGSETLQPFTWESVTGLGRFMGSLGVTLKSFACPAGMYTNLRGSWTIGMRVWVQTVAAGQAFFLETSAVSPKLRIERNAATIIVTRVENGGTSLAATAITGLTVGVHDIWITYDQTTGTVTGYLDGVAQTPVTTTTGACDIASFLIQFYQWMASEYVFFSGVKGTTEIEAMRQGMISRKGTLA